MKKVYYLLNYIPSFIHTILFLIHIKFGFVLCSPMDIVYAVFLYLVTPVYLVIINASYLIKGHISYIKSITCMLSVIGINVLWFIITHKIKTGYFIGDVPEGIYYLMFGVPASIILLGICIFYFIRNK